MRIRSVEAYPVRLARDLNAATGTAGSPTALSSGSGAYRWSEAYPCLYSTNFETALMRVTTDSGMEGWGEAQAPLVPEVACAIATQLLSAAVEGEEFEGTREEIERLWQRMYSTMRVRGQNGGFMLDAIAGVDIALWDLAGKIHRKSVAELLSAEPKKHLPAYLSGLPLKNRNEEAARYRDGGFMQCKLFFDTDEAGFFDTCDGLPPGLRIAVDALWRLKPENAVDFGRELDHRGALWLEAPLLPEDAAAHGRLAGSIRTPLALGESYRTCREMKPFFDEKALAIFQPDLGRCGLTEGMRLAEMAAAHGVVVVPHISIAMGPQIAAALHYAAAVACCHLTEYNPQVFAVANRFLREPLIMDGNRYAVPTGDGLGIEMNEDARRMMGIP